MTEQFATCIFSEDRIYRYLWERQVSGDPGRCLFIGVNPSKANEQRSDNTITRSCGFARRFGYGVLEMANLNAFRATDPKIMKVAHDPVGPDNDYYLTEAIRRADLIIVCWGIHGAYMDRAEEVLTLIMYESKRPYCLGKTLEGFPRHPSRLANNTELRLLYENLH